MNIDAKMSFSITSVDINDLPKFDETKRLVCPGHLTVKDVIGFVNGKMQFDKHILPHLPEGDKYDPFKHLDITMPVVKPLSHGESHQ
jgi:hypothetical protein